MGPNPVAQNPAQDLDQAYTDLLDALNDGFWAASTIEAKDKIKGVMDAVTDAIQDLDSADLTARNQQFTVLGTQLKTVNTQLQALQTQISNLVSRINTATSIISGITKVVTLVGQIFP